MKGIQALKGAVLTLVLLCLAAYLPMAAKAADTGYCKACGKTVSWQQLTEDAVEKTVLQAGHYKLSFAGGSCDWQEKSISEKVCIDLNGMTVRGIYRIFQVSKGGELSIQGEGLLIGGGFAANATTGERAGTVAAVHKDGNMNLYGGTLRSELYAPENVHGYNGGTMFVQGQFRMYGGTIEKGFASNAGGNIFIQTGGEVWMYDGVITGGVKQDVYCKGNMYLEGNASPGVVRLVNPTLTITGIYTGYLRITPTEMVEGALVGTSVNAQLVNPVAISGSSQLFVVVNGNQLVISKDRTDSTEQTVSQYCQTCGKEVSWKVLTESSANVSTLAAGHYKLSFAGGSCVWQEKTISEKVCIDATGMTVRGVHRIFQVTSKGELSLQGEGFWIGGGFAPDSASGDRLGALASVQKGGKMNLYGGTLRSELYAPENVHGYNGGILYLQGQFRMYGGRLEKGVATNAGGNIFIQTGGEVWMYDGVITGGDKQDVYCKGSMYLEGKASPGVVRLVNLQLTISGVYTGYLVVAPTNASHGMIIGTAQNAKLGNEVYVSHSDNRFFVAVENDQLMISKYQPNEPETIASRYCYACGRNADFIQLDEERGFPVKILTGHYYLNFSQDGVELPTMKMTLLDRVCLDLNGMKVVANGKLFDLQTKCTLNIMDSAGGGSIRRAGASASGATVCLGDAAVCNLYGGSLIGAGGEDCCIDGPAGKVGLYGGEVVNGSIRCAQGELRVGKTFSGSAGLEYPELLDGMVLGCGEKGFTGTLRLSDNMEATLLSDGRLIATSKNAAAMLCKKDGTAECYGDFSAAAKAFSQDTQKILLLKDVDQPVAVTKDLYVDLNGCSITGAISGDSILYCMDSATADYTVADGVFGTVTAAANVQPIGAGVAGSETINLMIDHQGSLGFHALALDIKSMSLRPEDAGVYFNGDFFGDEYIQPMVDRFGVMLSVEGDPLQDGILTSRTEFSGACFNTSNTSSLVYGIIKDHLPVAENNQRAAMSVFARPYIRFTDGQELAGVCCSRSLQEQVGLACQQWSSLNIKQKQGLWNLYRSYTDVMTNSGWNVSKLKSVNNTNTTINGKDYSAYLIPWEKDAVAEAKADGKIHYYFMASEGMSFSGSTRWGDACLVVLPDGQTMLIDSGPNGYAPLLLRNLQRLGITKLDTVIISHPHNDHHGGLFSETAMLYTGILDKIPVGQIYWRGGYDSESDDCSWVPDVAAVYGIPCDVLERGDVLHFGDVRMEVVWPMAGDGDSFVSNDLEINNFSVIFRLDYGEHSSLFTGDLYVKSVSGDRMLLNRTDHRLLDVDLLKVPHHGYDTSSSASLLRAVSPQIAVAMGHHEIPQLIFDEYAEVGCTLLGDRYYGYVHVEADIGGEMTYVTSRNAQPAAS